MFPKINQFTCDKMFIIYAQIGIYPQNLCKFSFIYKQKYAYLKVEIPFPILQCWVGPMLNSVFQNGNTHLSKKFYFNISVSQTYSKYYHCKPIFQFWLHSIYLLQLVFKRTSLFNWQHLDLQNFYRFQSNLSKKISHAALICFYCFCNLLIQSKHNNVKTTLCSAMLSSRYTTLNWQNSNK